MKYKILISCILIVLIMIAAGCGSLIESRSFINPNADFTFYSRVGLLPFNNLSDDRLAGEKMTDVFMTELLIGGGLDVMDPGQFNTVVAQVLKTHAPIAGQELSPAQLTQIAEIAKVQGIFMGTIHDYRMLPIGGDQYPLITMTVKFVDAPTGTVAWQNSTSATGGPNFPIVSIGETFTLGAMSQKVSRKVVKSFYTETVAK
jgi:hypothetical protein